MTTTPTTRAILITLPEGATQLDQVAVESLLKKALPQAALLVTFMGSGMAADTQTRVRSLLPRSRVTSV